VAAPGTPGLGDGYRGVQSVNRAFEVLQLIAATDEGAALSELATSSGLPVPTIHRILRSLVESGHVLQLASRRYALGPRMVGLGQSAARTLDAWTHPVLAGLAEATGETANLAMLSHNRVVYLAQATSQRHTVRMFTEVGSRVLPHCTGVGKALLAQLPPEAVRGIVTLTGMPARTEHTITDHTRLAEELTRVRDQGYAVDDQEQDMGVRCVAVAVPRVPFAAVSVSGPASRLPRPVIGKLVPVVTAAARELAGRLGRAGEMQREDGAGRMPRPGLSRPS